MQLWTFTLNSPLDWILAGLLFLAAIILLVYAASFIYRYTTGMLGGFIFMLVGLGMVMGPAFYLIKNQVALPEVIVCLASITLGCIAVLMGAFSMMNFRDF